MPGKPSRCTFCANPHRAEAEALVAGGMSVRGAAKQAAVPYQSFDRHIRNCVSTAVALAQTSREVKLGGKVLDRVEDLQVVTLELMQEARTGVQVLNKKGEVVQVRDSELALKAVSQARRNLELIAKLTGELTPPNDSGGDQLITMQEFEALYIRVRSKTTISPR